VGLEAQALGLEGQRPAAGERVVEGGQALRVEELGGARMSGVARAGAPPASPDLVPGTLEQRLVGGVLPEDELLDQREEPLALLAGGHLLEGRLGPGLAARSLDLLPALAAHGELALGAAPAPGIGEQLVAVARGVVDHLREDHRAGRGQRAPRPPQVQRRGVAVADRLLACRRLVDGVERQGDLDELPCSDHPTATSRHVTRVASSPCGSPGLGALVRGGAPIAAAARLTSSSPGIAGRSHWP